MQDSEEAARQHLQRDLENSATIFAVAQHAVNRLGDVASADDAISPEPAIEARQPLLPPASSGAIGQELATSWEDLIQQYGSPQGIRKALKARGITFSKTPSRKQLLTAWHSLESQAVQPTTTPQLPDPAIKLDPVELVKEVVALRQEVAALKQELAAVKSVLAQVAVLTGVAVSWSLPTPRD
ncbi:MAG: hypothetical protein EA001_01230 [Oscillatoriales cyanobacterium]|nr:MAG: hypothetical protein EA001_01230 [Oscillatoriales cyanobacterium]